MADEKVNFDDLDMAKAMAGEPSLQGGGGGGGQGGGQGGDGRQARTAKELEAVYDIPVTVSAVLGKATMQVNQLLKLGRGAVVEAIDIYVNNRLVARGEVVVVDERLGVTMTEIVKVDRS
jgi:flagellar motor switch protein FliN/FliY